MGNYREKGSHKFENNGDANIRSDTADVTILTESQALSTSTTSIEFAQEAGETLNFHIFFYKQNMACKQRQVYKWATAKLALTEELIRTNQLRSLYLHQNTYLEPDTDYLTDDEMEEVSSDQQLRSLENYRTELVELIGGLSISNISKKQKRRKGKRLKRRKLLSRCRKLIKNKNKNNGVDSELIELIGSLSISNISKKQKRRKGKCLKSRRLISKCRNLIKNKSNNNGYDAEMPDSSKLGAYTNRNRIVKRSPLQVKNY